MNRCQPYFDTGDDDCVFKSSLFDITDYNDDDYIKKIKMYETMDYECPDAYANYPKLNSIFSGLNDYDYVKKPIYHDIPNQVMYVESDLVKEIQNCSATCFSMMSSIIDLYDPMRKEQVKLLHDCARICESQVIYIVVKSKYSKAHAQMCAMICESCASECAKHNDIESRMCATICLECAKACFKYAQK